jgi:hypothetical protein
MGETVILSRPVLDVLDLPFLLILPPTLLASSLFSSPDSPHFQTIPLPLSQNRPSSQHDFISHTDSCHTFLPTSCHLNDLRIFSSTYNILELLVWHDTVVDVGINAYKRSDKGEKVGEAVWDEES